MLGIQMLMLVAVKSCFGCGTSEQACLEASMPTTDLIQHIDGKVAATDVSCQHVGTTVSVIGYADVGVTGPEG